MVFHLEKKSYSFKLYSTTAYTLHCFIRYLRSLLKLHQSHKVPYKEVIDFKIFDWKFSWELSSIFPLLDVSNCGRVCMMDFFLFDIFYRIFLLLSKWLRQFLSQSRPAEINQIVIKQFISSTFIPNQWSINCLIFSAKNAIGRLFGAAFGRSFLKNSIFIFLWKKASEISVSS